MPVGRDSRGNSRPLSSARLGHCPTHGYHPPARYEYCMVRALFQFARRLQKWLVGTSSHFHRSPIFWALRPEPMKANCGQLATTSRARPLGIHRPLSVGCLMPREQWRDCAIHWR